MPFDSTLGVLEIGILISGVLFGVVTTQVYIYHKNFPKDPLWVKLGFVDGLWLIELGHTVCISHSLYDYTVSHYGDAKELLRAPTSLGVAVLFHGIATVMVQAYFTYRIFRMSKAPYILPIFSCILMVTQLIAVTALSAQAIIVATTSLVAYLEKWEWLLTVALVLRSAADVTISAAMVYYLLSQRENAYKSTLKVVDQLIKWAIETGIVTSMLGILILITYHTNRANFAWLALFMVLPRVFSNTLLANMNSRSSLAAMQKSTVVSGTQPSAPSVDRFKARSGVNVTVTTESSELSTFDVTGGKWTSSTGTNIEEDRKFAVPENAASSWA